MASVEGVSNSGMIGAVSMVVSSLADSHGKMVLQQQVPVHQTLSGSNDSVRSSVTNYMYM